MNSWSASSIAAIGVFTALAGCGGGQEQDSGGETAILMSSPSPTQTESPVMVDPTPSPEPASTDASHVDPTQAAIDAAANTPPAEDPYLYLEEVDGEAALDTVRAWNAATLDKLKGDPRFADYEAEALAILNASDKIPYGQYRGGMVYNFWQDDENIKGLLRRATLQSYLSPDPEWETLLSIDALAEDEGANWVYKGSNCLKPDYTRCLLTLSDGGKDAATLREWDHEAKSFVEGGFVIPEAKSWVSWAGADALHLATDWGEGSLNESGYPFILKRLERGQSLDEAKEIIRGAPEDVFVFPASLNRGADQSAVPLALIGHTFYEFTQYWLSDEGPKALPLPRKATIQGYYKGQLLVTLQEDWTPVDGGARFAQGQLVSFDIDAWMATGALGDVAVVYAPGDRAAIEGVAITNTRVLVNSYENVRGRVQTFDFIEGAWVEGPRLNLPRNDSVSVSSAYKDSDVAFVNVEGYLIPDSMMAVDLNTNEVLGTKSLPDRFNTNALTVQQFEAESSDGERIPYSVVHREDMPLDGSHPTLLYGYGGFQISLTPSYSGTAGKLWLENGGVYVVANIRGGGEFGPAWHQAGLKTNRQIIYDDFIAVAEDLIARGITSPDKLGISGGSNGGLLVGVAYTQRPDLFNAVVCAVPLLDMVRYHLLPAGASWIGEYGDPDVAEERAFLETISPYHNVNPAGDYPTMLFLTSTKDDRVHPGHARKMAARLAEYGHPFEYYENIDGGHSAAANLPEAAKRVALQYTFLAQQLMDAPATGED